MFTFSYARVGEPIRHEALGVFPLFATPQRTVPYLLSEEALASRAVTVTEVNGNGSVPHLLVDNRSRSGVLFLEGEELRGAKQNRVLNASVLVAARSRTTIPVSCVEQDRWSSGSGHLLPGGSHASPGLRHVLKKSVHRSVSHGCGHASDQGEVWQEVGRQARSLGSRSKTGAMADTFDHCRVRIAEFRERIRYTEGAAGVAGAVGRRVVSVDLFDQPATCRKVWARLLSGLVLDALEATLQPPPEPAPEPGQEPRGARIVDMPFDLVDYLICSYWQAPGPSPAGPVVATADEADVWAALTMLDNASWRRGATVGAGQEFRAELDSGRYASALVCGGAVLHGSLVMAS